MPIAFNMAPKKVMLVEKKCWNYKLLWKLVTESHSHCQKSCARWKTFEYGSLNGERSKYVRQEKLKELMWFVNKYFFEASERVQQILGIKNRVGPFFQVEDFLLWIPNFVDVKTKIYERSVGYN